MKPKTKEKLTGFIMTAIGLVYLLNFGFGFIEFLPDNLPVIGNVDEGVAGALVFYGGKKLLGYK